MRLPHGRDRGAECDGGFPAAHWPLARKTKPQDLAPALEGELLVTVAGDRWVARRLVVFGRTWRSGMAENRDWRAAIARIVRDRRFRSRSLRSRRTHCQCPPGGGAGESQRCARGETRNWDRSRATGLYFRFLHRFQASQRRQPIARSVLDKSRSLGSPQSRRSRNFSPIAPDFVLELKPSSGNMKDLREKMAEYQDAGVKLGWLVDRQARTVELYRLGREPELRDRPEALDGETILPGFELDLNIVW